MCVTPWFLAFSHREISGNLFFQRSDVFSPDSTCLLKQSPRGRASLNSHLEESPLASRERRETPHERLLARGDYLQETPCESPLKRLLAKGDSLQETPRERDSSPETLCKRDCKRDSWRETPCEILNNQIEMGMATGDDDDDDNGATTTMARRQRRRRWRDDNNDNDGATTTTMATARRATGYDDNGNDDGDKQQRRW